jgi:hypothetical protein
MLLADGAGLETLTEKIALDCKKYMFKLLFQYSNSVIVINETQKPSAWA